MQPMLRAAGLTVPWRWTTDAVTARAMTMVFCYDIERDRTRARAARLLEARAVRVQKSVFEARLSSAEAGRLFDSVAAVLDADDSLRMYALSTSGLQRCRVHGGAPLPEDGDYWLL